MNDAAAFSVFNAVRFTIFGEPVPFTRAGAFGKRRFTPPKQRDYMLEVRRVAHEAMAGAAPFEGPLSVEVIAIYGIPATWSKKRRAETRWRTSRPDVDNIAKLIADAIGDNPSLSQTDKLGAIVFRDDASVCRLLVEKRYGSQSYVCVTVSKL